MGKITDIQIINSIYAQNKNNSINVLAQAKVQQAAVERFSGNQQINSVNSLPEQDLSGAIPVCQNSYSVSNSYVGAGLISEIDNVSTCLGAGEKNSVWYSFSSYSVGRLKFTITPNTLSDDYDFVLYDITGYSFSDIQNGVVIPVRCNFSATGGKTGLDSVGTNNSEPAAGPNFNPLLNLISGRKYMLNISNFSGSTFGYRLDFTGTTANIGGSNSSIQNVISYCGADSVIVNLSTPILNSSIASNGSDFTLASSSGTYNVISAQGTGNILSASIVLKLGSPISGTGTFSLNLGNGTDGNTLLNSCNNSAVGISTFTFNNSFIYAPPTAVCQNQSFTVSATPANSYTWTGALVPPAETNNQSLSITSNTTGNFTFTLATIDNCSTNTKTFAVTVNPIPNTVITSTATSTCEGTAIYLYGSGATNYLWSVINPSYEALPPINYTSSSFRANPMQDNVYKVIGTNNYGCSSAVFYTITTLAKPIMNITGADTVCYSNSTILSYTGNADTYTWTSVGVINTPTISVAPTSNFNYFLSGTNITTGCKTQISKYITVIGKASIAASKPNICIGDSSVLSVAGASSYTWTNGVTSSSVTVKPISTTTYTVSYENIAGCGVRSAIYTITVSPIPSLTITPSTNTICAGVQMNFASSSSVGISSYSWSTGSTAYLSWVTPTISPTNYTKTISLNATSSFGCKNSSSLTYTIVALPKIYTALSSGICSGDTSLLSASGALTYTWNPGNIMNSSIVVSPTITTNYAVAGISAEGCKNTQTVTVAKSTGSLSVVANPSVVCNGGYTTLTATGNGLLRWYNSDTATYHVATGLTMTTPTLSTGTYTYYVESTCTGSTYRKPVIFNVVNKPVIILSTNSNTVCYNASFQIIAVGANSYTWTSGPSYPSIYVVNDTLTQVMQTSYIVNYYVSGKDLNGCTATNSIVINAYPMMQTTVVATPTMVCPGSTCTLSLLGASSYTWNNGVVPGAVVVTPTASTAYTVNFPTNYGCVQPNSIYVYVDNSNVYINSPGTQTVCSGSTYTIVPIGASSYTWSTGAVSPNIVVTPTTNFSPSVAITYSVTGTNSYGCVSSAAKTFTVYPAPNVSFTANRDTVCLGTTLTMTATGALNYNYTWNTGFSGNIYNTSITVPTTFTVTGSGAYGCTKSYVKNIAVIAVIQVTPVANPSAICVGQSTQLFGIGVPNYTVDLYGSPYSTPKTVYPYYPSHVYTIYGKDIHGCASSKTVAVAVDVSARFNTNVSTYTICAGNNLTLSALNPTLSYVWSPIGATGSSVSISPTVTTIYTVTGTNSTCSYTVPISIITKPSPTISVASNGTLTCAVQPTLTATASPSVTYAWYYKNGGSLYGVSGTTNNVVANMPYVYYCYVTSTTNSCVSTASVSFPIDKALPSLTYTVSPICKGDVAQLFVGGASTYYFNSSGYTTNTVFTVSPVLTTTYTLWGFGSNGCQRTLTPTIVVNSNPTVSISGSTPICNGTSISLTSNGASSYTWNTGATTSTINETPGTTTTYSVRGIDANNCIGTASTQVVVNPTPTINVSNASICEGQSYTITPSGATSYTYSAGTDIVNPISTTIYSVTGSGTNNCIGSATLQVNVNSNPVISIATTGMICEGSSTNITANGANTYSWSTGDLTSIISITPTLTDTYTVTGTDVNNCSTTQTVSVIVDSTCADVWPGDANSDGLANNLDVLELGLHYTQTGASRATTSNNWQSYFANSWVGTISNGKNVNHSDCNGDGTINDDDTLAIFNNYSLTHAFKTAQTTTVNPQLSIVPDQPAVVKGTWGTASVYLGDATNTINNINGVAFAVNFDNTLIEPNNIYLEYQNSFIDASQNLYFRKLDFANGKIFTATTHTITNNVSGFGKIATLHYQIKSSLATDEVLNIGLAQANQSDAPGIITPLTSGTATLMAVGASVGIKEVLNNNNISISPNPTNGILNIVFGTIPQNTKIEVYNSIGALVLTEVLNNKNNTINTSYLSTGMYLIKVLENNRITSVQKIVKQ